MKKNICIYLYINIYKCFTANNYKNNYTYI